MTVLAAGTALAADEVRVFTALGIRFWDPVRDVQIRDGLRVAARPAGSGGPAARASRTASDVYAFPGLPAQTYLVEVDDPRRRFLPVAFAVDLPLAYRGVFLSDTASPPEGSPPGFLLFSAPTRPPAPELAAVRGELYDETGGRAAGHALVRVAIAERTRYGVADAAGRFAVFFPYPPFADALGGGAATPLGERSWDLELEVYYDPAAQAALPGTLIPEYRSILGQPRAEILTTDSGASAAPQWTGTLTFRQELVARTEGRTQLLVSPSPGS